MGEAGSAPQRVTSLLPPVSRRAGHALRRRANALRPGEREQPTYFIVGAKRAGTTSLDEYVVDHPQVLRGMVEKGCRYGFDVYSERRNNSGNRDRVGDVGLAAFTTLGRVRLGRHLEGLDDHFLIGASIWTGECLEHGLQGNFWQPTLPPPWEDPLDRHDHIHRLQHALGQLAPRQKGHKALRFDPLWKHLSSSAFLPSCMPSYFSRRSRSGSNSVISSRPLLKVMR